MELRARWRPTPNGEFAAAAPARIGGRGAVLRLGDRHYTRSVPSGAHGWLRVRLLASPRIPAVLDRVRITTCGLATRRGQRFELERDRPSPARGRPSAGIRQRDRSNGAHPPRLRGGRRRPGTGRAGGGQVAGRQPEAAIREAVSAGSEVRHGIAPHGPASRGPAGCSPGQHLLGRVPAVLPVRDSLERMRSLLAEADRHRPGDPARLAALHAAREEADQVCMQQRPLSVDVIANACVALPKSVADAAADAAALLWRIGERQDPLAAYHRVGSPSGTDVSGSSRSPR